MIDPVIFFPLFLMGLVSSAHCIGMCGGIMGALTMAIPATAKAQRWMILVAYNAGRILSYAFMGMLAGLFAEQFAAMGGSIILRLLAGTLLIAMGLYLADWWRGLTKLENVGRYMWVYIQPIGKRLMPVDSIPKALLLGALWGWLPCGLVYAALAMAMTQPSASLAAGAMFAFGLGTLPAVLAAGVAAQQLARILQQKQLRVAMAIIIIIFGVWTMWGSMGHDHQHMHTHSDQTSTEMDHQHMDHSHMGYPQMDDTQMNHAQMDHSQMNHANMDHTAMNHTDMNVEHNMEHHSTNFSSTATLERQRTDLNQGSTEDKANSSSSSQEANGESHYH